MCIKPPIEKEIFVFLQREKIKIMPRKSYKTQKNTPITVNEPVAAYQTAVPDISSSNEWNPNVPFHGTQEEWWEHFHRIEEGPFYLVSEVYQRISQWLDNQKM